MTFEFDVVLYTRPADRQASMIRTIRLDAETRAEAVEAFWDRVFLWDRVDVQVEAPPATNVARSSDAKSGETEENVRSNDASPAAVCAWCKGEGQVAGRACPCTEIGKPIRDRTGVLARARAFLDAQTATSAGVVNSGDLNAIERMLEAERAAAIAGLQTDYAKGRAAAKAIWDSALQVANDPSMHLVKTSLLRDLDGAFGLAGEKSE